MKYVILIIMMLAFITDPIKIGKINTVKKDARKAFLAGDYKTAIEKYHYLIDSLDVQEDEVKLNLANAYYQANDTTNAMNTYQAITQSSDKVIRSKAEQQLGVMTNRTGKAEEALNHFKQAIKADPANADARYNYEMLKKKLDEQKKQEQQQQNQQNKDQNKQDQQKQKEQQNKDQQKQEEQKKKEEEQKEQEQKDQQKKEQQDQQKKDENKDQKQKEQEQKEQQEQQQKEEEQNKDMKDVPPQVSEKLKEMKISEEKARMILEAMKNQEIQYLQQNKRKATKPRDRSRPDW